MATKLRVLLVEDSPDDAELIVLELRECGYEVEWARVEREEDFLARVGEGWDIALLDMNLPMLSQERSLELVQQHRHATPFIVVSGSIGDEAAVECLRRGAFDFLLKDRLRRLGQAVENAMGRRRAEREAQELQQRLEELINTVEGIVWERDGMTSRCTFASRQVERITGIPAPDWMEEGFWISRIHPADLERVLAAQRGMKSGATGFELEYRLQARSGSHLWIGERITAVRQSDESVLLRGIAVDISDRVRHAHLLGMRHEMARLFLMDLESWDDIMRQMLRLLCESLDFEVGEYRDFHPPTNNFERRQHWPVETSGPAGEAQPVASGTHPALQGLREDERTVWLADLEAKPGVLDQLCPPGSAWRSFLAFQVRGGSGLLGAVFLFAAEALPPEEETLEHLRQLGSEIGQFLEARNLKHQLRQAQRMESVGLLAGGIAHDFNNILTVIQCHSSLILQDTTLSEDLRESANEIAMASGQAANLTRQLLTLSRKQSMQARPLDLNEVVGSMTKLLKRLLGEDIELRLRLDGRGCPLQADLGMVEQVVMNLVLNSRDAMPGGGELRVETSRENFEGGESSEWHPALPPAPGCFACLTVSDSGCGIPAEILPRVFEPFFTTKEVGRGTGLGLATVHGIVQLHRGAILVRSEPARGTAFRILFPLADRTGAAVAEAAATTATTAVGMKGSILLVEDEVSVRTLARIILTRRGFRVIEAESGVAAMRIWRARVAEIELIVTDIIMPEGLSGLDLIRQIRAEHPAIKVLFMSGYSSDLARRDIVLPPDSRFLQKPYTPAQLTTAVENALAI